MRPLRRLVPAPVKAVLRRTLPYRLWARRRDLIRFAAPLAANGLRHQLSGEVEQWAPFLRFAPPGHFYSPIPRRDELRVDAEHIWAQRTSLRGIDSNDEVQRNHIERIAKVLAGDRLPDRPDPERRYHAQNTAYGIGDATMLHGMLRLHRPARIVEIGSGWSSALMLDTIERHLPGTHATFIDPYTDLLRALMRAGDDRWCTIFEHRAQDLDLAVIRELQRNDVLFIDSTHVVRPGSDVCHIMFELLPAVAPGVIVHLHDIFWPFEQPRPWVEEGRLWSECYLVRALLTDNPTWEILLFNDYIGFHERELLEHVLPEFLQNTGGSLWLRRALAGD
jgi:predicted O-methyltransferase YrrM